MPTFILRNIPDDLWEAVKERRQIHKRPLRPLLLDLLSAYAYAGYTPLAVEWPSEAERAAEAKRAGSTPTAPSRPPRG
jgi:hypothetical protein